MGEVLREILQERARRIVLRRLKKSVDERRFISFDRRGRIGDIFPTKLAFIDLKGGAHYHSTRECLAIKEHPHQTYSEVPYHTARLSAYRPCPYCCKEVTHG